MKITNEINDAMKKDSSPSRSIGSERYAPALLKMTKEENAEITAEIMRWMEKEEENEDIISTQEKTRPEVQTPNSILQQQMNQALEIEAVTSRLITENRHYAAVEKYQENSLKHQDNLQIQNIQNYLRFTPPIPITNNVSVKVEPPLDAFPAVNRRVIMTPL